MASDKSNQNETNKWPQPKSPWEKMIDCNTCKGRHFGVGGAAGMLLVRRDDTKADRPATHVILQHRSFSTTAGGTWAMPGGALDNRCETPRQAAIREASEEVALPRACADGPDPSIGIWYENAFLDHGSWKYTTVIADVIKPFEPTVPQGDSESLETKWVAIQDVETLPLHPSFEQAWPELKSILETVPGTSITY